MSKQSTGSAYLLLLDVQRGAERLAYGGARWWGGRLSQVVLRAVRTGHGVGIICFVGVTCGREYHHHSGQGQRPSLLDEPPHSRRGGWQRAERQGQALPAGAVRTVRTARAILLHARGGSTSHSARLERTTTKQEPWVARQQLPETHPTMQHKAEVAIFRFQYYNKCQSFAEPGNTSV